MFSLTDQEPHMQTARRTLLFTLAFIFLTVPLVSNAQGPLQFVPITPCRVVDTRPGSGGGGPIQGGTFQTFPIQDSGSGQACGIPSSAAAYSLNVTVVPDGPLGYLTVWPAGQNQPVVSTTNSVDGRVKANAAIVGAGSGNGGPVSVFASNTTNVVLDINGYFAPITGSTLAFYPLTPCRVLDTRNGQFLQGGQQYAFPVSGICNIPTNASAYSLNFTAVPHQPLGYLTVWPAGQSQPVASILNAVTGTVTANAATIQAGTDNNGNNIDVFASNDTDLVIDVNGYFAPVSSAPGGLSLFTLTPCRLLDTRPNGQFSGTLAVDTIISSCGLPSTAQTVVVNATVVPPGPLGYLTLWPNGQPQPVAATLNAVDGVVTSNLAVVPTTNGFVNAFASNLTQLVVDVFDYFAIPSGLNGNYTFSINGYNSAGPVMMVGSFLADGNGNVSGVLDVNSAGGSPLQKVAFKGTYSIQPNGLGTITITPTLNTPFHLSIAISSTGNGRLVLNSESTSYLPNTWGAGAITVQNPADLSFSQIAGSYVSGFSGVDPSLNRYAGAGMYLINQTQNLSATSVDTNDNGVLGMPLTSGMLTSLDPNTGRGTATLVTSAVLNHWVFYVTSANELTWLSIDPISSPANLLLQTMLRQATLPFGQSSLMGVSVARTSGLSHTDKQKRRPQAGSTDVVLGLFTADGAGNATFSYDENNGGTLNQQQMSQGTYSVAANGRTTLTGFGSNPPIFYLVNQNEAFVLGQDASVALGFLVPQSGAPFSNATAIGTYWGGNYMPVTANVTDSITTAFSDGNGNLTGTNVTSDMSGVGGGTFMGTYSVDATGRLTLTENGNLAAILYVISPTRVALLSATDTDPSVAVLGSTN
jgi:hypothetical protein